MSRSAGMLQDTVSIPKSTTIVITRSFEEETLHLGDTRAFVSHQEARLIGATNDQRCLR
jgi:hypothetical protein